MANIHKTRGRSLLIQSSRVAIDNNSSNILVSKESSNEKKDARIEGVEDANIRGIDDKSIDDRDNSVYRDGPRTIRPYLPTPIDLPIDSTIVDIIRSRN